MAGHFLIFLGQSSKGKQTIVAIWKYNLTTTTNSDSKLFHVQWRNPPKSIFVWIQSMVMKLKNWLSSFPSLLFIIFMLTLWEVQLSSQNIKTPSILFQYLLIVSKAIINNALLLNRLNISSISDGSPFKANANWN